MNKLLKKKSLLLLIVVVVGVTTFFIASKSYFNFHLLLGQVLTGNFYSSNSSYCRNIDFRYVSNCTNACQKGYGYGYGLKSESLNKTPRPGFGYGWCLSYSPYYFYYKYPTLSYGYGYGYQSKPVVWAGYKSSWKYQLNLPSDWIIYGGGSTEDKLVTIGNSSGDMFMRISIKRWDYSLKNYLKQFTKINDVEGRSEIVTISGPTETKINDNNFMERYEFLPDTNFPTIVAEYTLFKGKIYRFATYFKRRPTPNELKLQSNIAKSIYLVR